MLCTSPRRRQIPEGIVVMTDSTTKKCSKCGQEKPLSQYKKDKRYTGGHIGKCRDCLNASHRQWHKANSEHVKARSKKWRDNNPEKQRAYKRRYKEKHYEKVCAGLRAWRARNQAHVLNYSRSYNQSAAGYARAKRWRRGQHGRLEMKLNQLKRYMRKKQLPFAFTAQDWRRCLEYFNHRCAICGRPRGLWHTLAPDHWIPLADKRPDNPGTVPTNIVPLCHGQDGCNNSKLNHSPEEWLAGRYSKSKATQILARIQAYFDSL